MAEGAVSDQLPPEVLERWSLQEVVERGRQRFEVYCVYCHDHLGTGNGFVPQRGYPAPPTYHSPRVRALPLGTIFRVITNGKGRMPPYGSQVAEADRWAIAAYIRTLQFSQYASLSGLEPEDQSAIEALAGSDPAAVTGGAR
jgi:mono/diheme cytochrome c family protein